MFSVWIEHQSALAVASADWHWLEWAGQASQALALLGQIRSQLSLVTTPAFTHTHCPRFYIHTLSPLLHTHTVCHTPRMWWRCMHRRADIRKWPSWITLVPPAYSFHGCDEYIGAMHLKSAGANAETHFSSQGRYFHFHFQNVESSRSFIHLARSRFDLVCSDLPCFTNSHPSVTISFILLPTCLWQIHSQKVKNGRIVCCVSPRITTFVVSPKK